MSIKSLRGIRSLADRYDTYVIDLWGTLHNGIVAYPGAIDALTRLKEKGKRIGLLSNAPRRAKPAVEMLEGMGIKAELYDAIITSGESVFRALRDRPDPWTKKLTGACWHLGSSRDRHLFEGLDIDLREHPEPACGFCVNTGAKMNEERLEDYQEDLDKALAMGLPMICANPDIWVPVGDILAICAGAFAEYYESKGGDVSWHGKPRLPIYRQLFAELEAAGATIDPARTLAIGDGLHTDVAGAAGAGIAGALLVGGVHAPDLKLNWRGKPNGDALTALIDKNEFKPDHMLRRFAW
jgi:HAD superfamily hydrolase (TIGR01459 family)